MQHLKQKILIVDDTPANITSLTEVLGDLDVEIVSASSGNDAVAKAFEYDFDLILMDVQMPGMDGFEAIKLIKKEEKNHFIPTLFQTAISSNECNVLKGIQAGAIDFISKPISEEILIAKVKLLLEMQKSKKELILIKEELYRTNNDLIKSNKKNEKANRIVIKNAKKIEAAAEAKSNFLSIMSHEIRTPLNAIMGSTGLLKGSGTNDERLQYINII